MLDPRFADGPEVGCLEDAADDNAFGFGSRNPIMGSRPVAKAKALQRIIFTQRIWIPR
jgi:hypothetical protein